MFRIILLISVLSLASALEPSVQSDSICTRSDGRTGYCVKLAKCTSIVNMIMRRRKGIPLTSFEENYIKNSSCPDGKPRHVCCEMEDKVSEGIERLSNEKCGSFLISKVIGGREVKLMTRPWMALLYFHTIFGTNVFSCGGTLINKRYILTAAHCFQGQTLLSVRLGEHDISSESDCETRKGKIKCIEAQDFEVERVLIHELYSPQTAHNDIALIKLKTDVDTTIENIKPICLPVNDTLQQSGETLPNFRVAGWGKTEYNVQTNVLTEICAGEVGRDSCNGDSGGPMINVALFHGIQRFVQFGIVSMGSRRCGDGTPGVYTKVSSYIPWIAYKMVTN